MRSRVRALEGGLLLVFAAAVSFSIALSEIAFLSALALRIGRAIAGDPFPWRPRTVALTALALVAAWLLSGFFAPEPLESLRRVNRLYQIAVVFLVAERAADSRWAERAISVYLAATATGALLALGLWLPEEMGKQRMIGLFSTGMTTGNALAMAVVAAVAVTMTRARWRRVAAGLAGLACALALAATETRSSWLGALGGTAALGARRGFRKGAAIALVLLGSAAVAVWSHRGAETATPGEYTAQGTTQGRVSLWLTGWDLFRERPLLGWGLADHSRRIEERRRPDATFRAGHFHNNLVQVAVSTGAIGLFAYLAFQAALGLALWSRRRHPLASCALGVWVAFQIAGLFDWSFGDAEVAYAFFLWMGLGTAENDSAAGGIVDRSQARC